MLKKIFLPLVIFFTAVIFTGCLTTEYKQYHFSLNDDGSGTAVIKYINILSQKGEGEDTSEDDFNELKNSYLEGTSVEDEFPGSKVISKEIFVEDGKLMGEVKLEFPDLKAVKLYIYDENSPIMFYLGAFSETYLLSNGKFDENIMPVVFWDKGLKELDLKTRVTDLTDDTSHVSLAAKYEEWKKAQN